MPFSTQLELFRWSGTLQWLPDEILFSLASRYHVLAGHRLASQTCMQLFGHRQRGSAHDLPSRIDELVNRVRGELGSAETIILQHTILPFYLPFRDRETADMAVATIRGDGIEGLKFQLGLLTSRFRAHHPLKACARCMVDDRLKFQVAYWHVMHQYPGVWICPDHEVELLESAVKSTGVGRFLWHLPHESTLVTANRNHYVGRLPDQQRFRLLFLARAAIALARLPNGFFFDAAVLLRTYQAALSMKGLCAANGRLRLQHIGPQYLKFVSPYRVLPELSALPVTERQASAQLSRLLYPPRTGTHPLRHLMVILWLFDSWEFFLQAYAQCCYKTTTVPDLFWNPISLSRAKETQDGHHARFLELVTQKGKSVTNAAHDIGIDPATGMAWAAQAGIATARRAKILKQTVLSGLVHDLRDGVDKEIAAARHHVSVSSVDRVLRTVIGLQNAWRAARLERARQQYRNQWKDAVFQSNKQGPKAARRLAPAAYAWLQRNDREWLRNQNMDLPPTIRTNHSSTDWDGRDKNLGAAVEHICQSLAKSHGGSRVSIRQVCCELPELKPKLARLDRLPQTRRALEKGNFGVADLGHRHKRR